MSVVLSVDDVALAFGGVKALDGVSFGVSEGEVVGLIGPNGAGKTTLFDCISGFQRPQRGSIRLSLPGRKAVELTKRPAYERTSLGWLRSSHP